MRFHSLAEATHLRSGRPWIFKTSFLPSCCSACCDEDLLTMSSQYLQNLALFALFTLFVPSGAASAPIGSDHGRTSRTLLCLAFCCHAAVAMYLIVFRTYPISHLTVVSRLFINLMPSRWLPEQVHTPRMLPEKSVLPPPVFGYFLCFFLSEKARQTAQPPFKRD